MAILMVFLIWGMVFISAACLMDDIPEFLEKLRKLSRKEKADKEDD